MRRGGRRDYISRVIRRFFGKERWYSWVDSNHRPPDPQSGALNQLSYSCTACGFCFAHDFSKNRYPLFGILRKRAKPRCNAQLWQVGSDP
jgi:hypothetical protein